MMIRLRLYPFRASGVVGTFLGKVNCLAIACAANVERLIPRSTGRTLAVTAQQVAHGKLSRYVSFATNHSLPERPISNLLRHDS